MDKPCLLPDQTDIYLHGYLPFIFLSVVLLIWLNLKAPVSSSRSKLSLTAANTHNRSLPFFDASGIGNARYFDKASVGGSYDDREDTPRGSAMNRTTSLSHHTSILHPTASGLRTPVMQGSSPFASPLLSPVLPPPDVGGDGDSDNGNGKESDDDNGDGDANRVAVDEEGGLRTGSPRFRSTPRTPTSYPFPNTPTPGSSGKWEAGTWRRGAGGSARTLFGHTSAKNLGLGLGMRGGEREREREKVGRWGRVHGGALGGWAGMGMWRGWWWWCGRVVHGALLGRPLSSVDSAGASSFWRRCAWDGMCVALPGWVCFGVVSWWYVW